MLITIPIVNKISNNKLRTVHWGTRAKITHEYIDEILKQKILFRPTTAVDLIFTFYFKNIPLDNLNCSGMCKAIEDGLVEAGVLKDDGPKFVSSVTLISKVSKTTPRIEIEIK